MLARDTDLSALKLPLIKIFLEFHSVFFFLLQINL